MDVVITTNAPAHSAVHLAFGSAPPHQAAGVILAVPSAEAALDAARVARPTRTDWVVHGIVAGSERDSVAFLIALGRCVRGRVWVVLDPRRGTHVRVAGHLLRAGCEADASWVCL